VNGPTSLDRLQPSLLDRLTDDEPGSRTESREWRGMSAAALRESVRRELSVLLNATHLGAVVDLTPFPEVADSTLNYGVPDLAGRTASTLDRAALARAIRRAITLFEPRLLKSSLRVELTIQSDQHDRNAVHLDIEADLWAQPVPLRLRWRADLNLEDGEARVADASGEP
jgi:type VI secretion system protein ImpF